MAMAHTTTDITDWVRSDEYHNKYLLKPDEGLRYTLDNSKSSGLPDIAVSEAQGKFLNLLARSINAERILEVGTLGGYSTIWLAKAVPDDGKVISLDIEELHVKVANENIAKAGVANKVEVILGPAADTLKTLEVKEPFDLVFIDADKPNNVTYFTHGKRLLRKNGVIIVDNVVRRGRVSLPDYTDDNVEGVRALLEYVKNDPEVEATTIATVGTKGYDGFLYAIKL